MLRPFASFRESLLVCRCEWFVVDCGVCDRAGDGVEKALEHADRGGYLVRGKVLDQFVGVLFVGRHDRVILHRDVLPTYSFAVALPMTPAYDKPMVKAKKFELDSPAPIPGEEDEETLAAIDEGIRDAKDGRTVPAEEVRTRLPEWITGSHGARAPDATIALGLGLTNECNLSCSFCYRDPARIDRLSLEQVKSVMERLPIRSVNLGTGENGMHPDFKAILAYLRTRPVKLTLTSNGHSVAELEDNGLRPFTILSFLSITRRRQNRMHSGETAIGN